MELIPRHLWRTSHDLAAAAHHAAHGIPVPLIIIVVLAVIAAGLISWRQR